MIASKLRPRAARVVAALGCAALVLPATASATTVGGGGPTPFGIASDHVEFVRYVPFEAGTATGARIIGHYMYTTSWRSLSIYDVSDPTNPQLMSTTPLAKSGDPVSFENENVATNGNVLIFSETIPRNILRVYDVEDKTNPTEVASVDTTTGAKFQAANHTMTCLFDCKWLWGSTGAIVDLHDPAHPKVIPHLWNEGLPGQQGHNVVEVKPGYVLTATQPMMYLDARDPIHPKLLAVGGNADKRFIHSSRWPNSGNDRFALATGETNFQPRCGNSNGSFMVWDTKGWQKTHTMTMTDDYRVSNGDEIDGSPPANTQGCSSHWFQENPTFENGGLVASGFYDHGMRFFDVSGEGKIKLAGYFLPYAADTSAAYWVTDRIVYGIDYENGFYILKWTGKL